MTSSGKKPRRVARLYGFRVEQEVYCPLTTSGWLGFAAVVRSDGACETRMRGPCATRAELARDGELWRPRATHWCAAHEPRTREAILWLARLCTPA
jgi:hypothetical protein